MCVRVWAGACVVCTRARVHAGTRVCLTGVRWCGCALYVYERVHSARVCVWGGIKKQPVVNFPGYGKVPQLGRLSTEADGK